VEDWQRIIKKELKDAAKICILGIGNIQRGDDGAGPLVVAALNLKLKQFCYSNLLLIDGGEVPENFTGKIRDFKPTHTLIIDSCLSGKKPGTIYLVESGKIKNDELSTHKLPLSMLIKFIEESIKSQVIVLGIEPQNLSLGDPPSSEVLKSVQSITEFLLDNLRYHNFQIFISTS